LILFLNQTSDIWGNVCVRVCTECYAHVVLIICVTLLTAWAAINLFIVYMHHRAHFSWQQHFSSSDL